MFRRCVHALSTLVGMSTRAIAPVTGVDHSSIVRDRQVVHSAPPAPAPAPAPTVAADTGVIIAEQHHIDITTGVAVIGVRASHTGRPPRAPGSWGPLVCRAGSRPRHNVIEGPLGGASLGRRVLAIPQISRKGIRNC